MILSVKPKEIVKTHIIEKIDISISYLILDESVTINVLLISSDAELIDSINLTLENEDYSQWSSDDSYITNKILQLLELEKQL